MAKRIVGFKPVVTQEMKDVACRVIDSGHYIRTTPTEEAEGKALEEEFGAFLVGPDGRRPRVANVANGTAAMHLAWAAYEVGPGDEVIVPANTFSSVAHCVSLVGATPVFVDVEPDIYNMDSRSVAAAITPRTRAIMPVHTAGHPADLDPLLELARRHNLLLIEDACQSIGARYKGRPVGTLGQMGCYSFVQNKAMTCGGEGGAVGSFDEAKVRRVFTLANHARGERFHAGNKAPDPAYQVIHDGVGFNYRQSEILSAIARVQLRLLPEWIRARKKYAALYKEMLKDADLPVQVPAERPWADHSYVRFEVVTPHRATLRPYLDAQGIRTNIHYPTPLHLDEPYRTQPGMKEGSLPVAERLAREVLSLPIYPQMTEDDVAYVVDHVKAFFKKKALTTA
ncbi:MAG: DegT/DnrJ/EryC1/StrS family aminotransferase [Armatimonadetes bacterium]|nr:DegT/DnrJ/EryC1/StrS family aminotransferase [Armatimonadota bacterium]